MGVAHSYLLVCVCVSGAAKFSFTRACQFLVFILQLLKYDYGCVHVYIALCCQTTACIYGYLQPI